MPQRLEEPEAPVRGQDDHGPLGNKDDLHGPEDQAQADGSDAVHGAEEDAVDEKLQEDVRWSFHCERPHICLVDIGIGQKLASLFPPC